MQLITTGTNSHVLPEQSEHLSRKAGPLVGIDEVFRGREQTTVSPEPCEKVAIVKNSSQNPEGD